MHKLPETIWTLFQLVLAHPILSASTSALGGAGFVLFVTSIDAPRSRRRRLAMGMMLVSLLASLGALLFARSRVP